MEIRSHLNPPAPWVVLLGLDGSGKSTVLAALETIFSPPAFPETRIISRHPGFLYDRLLQVKPSSHHSDDGPIAIEHYGKPPHGAIKSVGKLGILALDWFAGYWGQLVHQRAKGHLILFDRHFFLDIAIDPLRYRYGGPLWDDYCPNPIWSSCSMLPLKFYKIANKKYPSKKQPGNGLPT